MIDLQECRNEIDKIDSDIIRLFEQRMKVCEDVAEYKIRTGKKVLDPERERQKLEVLRGKAHGEFNQLGAQELFHAPAHSQPFSDVMAEGPDIRSL